MGRKEGRKLQELRERKIEGIALLFTTEQQRNGKTRLRKLLQDF
jgi:hypothetical protein